MTFSVSSATIVTFRLEAGLYPDGVVACSNQYLPGGASILTMPGVLLDFVSQPRTTRFPGLFNESDQSSQQVPVRILSPSLRLVTSMNPAGVLTNWIAPFTPRL